MFGMAGGTAGQYVVGPLIGTGLAWNRFWIGMGVAGILLAVPLFLLLPREAARTLEKNWVKDAVTAMGAVFRNPQSILCGLISGLLSFRQPSST